jgi:antitoxin component HigA of HigAB toxin-antitoxin module
VKTARRPHHIKDLPRKYADLVDLLPPRPIHTEGEYGQMREIIDLMAGHKLSRDQADYLEALTTFFSAYEEARHAIDTSDISGIEILQHLLDENDMNASDLARLLEVHPTMGSKILRGGRALTVEHLRKLANHFRVSPELFMRPSAETP